MFKRIKRFNTLTKRIRSRSADHAQPIPAVGVLINGYPTDTAVLRMHLPKPQRRPELDALRGLFLVWMTLTHLPTRFSDFVNQPIGFVSSAEGFVFLSALLVSRVYMRQAIADGTALRNKLWRRSLRIYAYHLLMLALAFTVAAAYAV